MISKIVNETINEEIIFDNVKFVLSKFDANAGAVTNVSFKGINQIGVTQTASLIETRDISLEIYIQAKDAQEMKENKRKLARVTNPLNEITVIYKGNKIRGTLKSTPKYSTDSNNNTNYIAFCVLDVFCPNPCFTSETEFVLKLIEWSPNFHFPARIVKKEPLGKRTRKIAEVDNIGDIENGMIIEFEAKGPLKNPTIMNVKTREYIKIPKEMVAGEKITINTRYGAKSIKSNISGNIINLFKKDTNNKWLQLQVGNNIFKCTSDTNEDYLTGKIYFEPQFLTI